MPDLWGESPFLISCCQILTESYSRPRTKVGFFFRKKETTMVEKTTILSTTKSLVVGRFALRCPKFQFRTKPIGFSSRIWERRDSNPGHHDLQFHIGKIRGLDQTCALPLSYVPLRTLLCIYAMSYVPKAVGIQSCASKKYNSTYFLKLLNVTFCSF